MLWELLFQPGQPAFLQAFFQRALRALLLREQQEKVRKFADLGGRLGLGSDAGAWRVLHGQGAVDEAAYLGVPDVGIAL